MRGYTIGALASACAVGRDTIRYYERSGLMPRPDRTISGYRIYGDGDVERINFIRTAQSLGFTLNEIGLLLSIRGSQSASAAAVVRLTEEKIGDLSGKLRQLRAIRGALEQLVADCPLDVPASDCPILQYISHPQHRFRPKRNSRRSAGASSLDPPPGGGEAADLDLSRPSGRKTSLRRKERT